MLIFKSGTQHWEDHISVKYWSILKIYDIFKIRILWASQKLPNFLSNVLWRPINRKKQSVQSISGHPVSCGFLNCELKLALHSFTYLDLNAKSRDTSLSLKRGLVMYFCTWRVGQHKVDTVLWKARDNGTKLTSEK